MSLVRLLCAVALAALAGPVAVRGFDLELDRRALEVAQGLGRSPIAADHARFHAAYRVTIDEPPVDYLEVITPFRRVVLTSESAVVAGRRVGQRQALDALGDDPQQVDLVIELTFHPLNTFVGVPDYTVTLVPASPDEEPIEPRSVARVPRNGPRVTQPLLPTPLPVGQTPLPQGSQPLVGGTLIVALDGRQLDEAGVYDVVIADGAGEEVARATVDMGAFR